MIPEINKFYKNTIKIFSGGNVFEKGNIFFVLNVKKHNYSEQLYSVVVLSKDKILNLVLTEKNFVEEC